MSEFRFFAVALALAIGCGGGSTNTGGGWVPVQDDTPAIMVTGAAQALSRVTSDPIDEDKPMLSPDGRVLLFHTYTSSNPQYDAYGNRVSDGERHFSINGVDPTTGARRTLYTSPNTSAAFPAWMPDGSSFVYTTDAVGQQSIVRALSSAPNSGMAIVVSGAVAPSPSQPVVSPDGRTVAFETNINGQIQIAMSGLDGSNMTIFGAGRSPSWHPQGGILAFIREVGGVDQLFTIDTATGTGLTQLINDDLNQGWPTWSPDGRFIAFATHQNGNWRLYCIKPDGTGLIQLTEGTSSAASPHWGTDGFIYFSSNAMGNWDIWRFKPIGELELQRTGQTPDTDAPVVEAPAG